MDNGVYQQIKNYQYQLRGVLAVEGSSEQRENVALAEADARAMITKLKHDYPDGFGILGGLLAVIDEILVSAEK
ncbi:hypothetical protein [Morganella morganii]|uniref:hypothetical protein n=1 Tax=Morganella morganii TaxID=582 RepID=UPI00339CD24C